MKASIALEERELEYETHLVTLADADVKSPKFLSLNPNNKIPEIIDPNGPNVRLICGKVVRSLCIWPRRQAS